MRALLAVTLVSLVVASDRAVRFPQNPIVTPASSPSIGDNINGPSLIRVPAWVERPLGRYYLYFSSPGNTSACMPTSCQDRGRFTSRARSDSRRRRAASITSRRRTCMSTMPGVRSSCTSLSVRRQHRQQRPRRHQRTEDVSGDFGRWSSLPVGAQPLGPRISACSTGARLLRHRARRHRPALAGTCGRHLSRTDSDRRDSGRLLRHAAVDVHGDVLRVYYSRIGIDRSASC